MNYIDLFKTRISKEAMENGDNKQYIDSLFNVIRSDIIQVARLLRLSEVDDTTLEDYFETAKKEYLSVNPIDPGISHSLTKPDFKTWLTLERESEISWNYSNRYMQHLRKMGRSQKVVDETERSSLSIVSKMADPKSKTPVYIKGLVVGAVQSGKTGNFNAVINRAIDSGYGLIIVLSGIMEDLRSQTQKRIESDVIGEGRNMDTNFIGKKGVGEIERFGPIGNSKVNQVKSITSPQSDFSMALLQADFSLNDTNVLVCKKNVSVLRNLIVWLHDYLDENKERHNIPMLILDDEADNASLNNMGARGRNYASKTNSQIRALLALFNKKTYLGYTATPFANVLQDRNDIPDDKYQERYKVRGEAKEKTLNREGNIFPDDFIELLDPPSNYIGAKQIFETVTPIDNATDENEKIPLIAPPVIDHIDDFPSRIYENEDGIIEGVENITSRDDWDDKFGHGGYLDFSSYSEYRRATSAPRKDNSFPKKLPQSLKDAVRCFILALAIRESRIPMMNKSDLFQPHNTMLIHVSRFTFWQNKTKTLLDKYLETLIAGINNDHPNSKDSVYLELETIWYQYYAHIVESVKDYLPKNYEDEFMVPIVFESVKKLLGPAVKGIEIKAINSQTKEKLEYPKNNPKKIIAVGGNRLSRGFTLEGLTINYFIRTTNYSDTLLQMGRWFGYRPGYLDCCKIFTTPDSLHKFNSTTKCIEELETEFKKMERQGKSPSKFVLRVKKHPGTLKITRPSILRNTREVKWSYQDQREMTTNFDIKKDHLEKVWANFRSSIAPRFNSVTDQLLTFKANGEELIEILQNQPNNFKGDTVSQMSKFIELCNNMGKLNDWTVALKVTGISKTPVDPSEFNIKSTLVDKISLAGRSGPKENPDDMRSFLENKVYKASGKNANIISSNTDLAITLSNDQKKTANDTFHFSKAMELRKKDKFLGEKESLVKARSTYKTVPDTYFRSMMSENNGLLVIYLLDAHYVFNQKGRNSEQDPKLKRKFKDFVDNNGIDLDIPLVGYVISFPPMDPDPGDTYVQGDYELDFDEGEEEEVGDDTAMILDLNEI